MAVRTIANTKATVNNSPQINLVLCFEARKEFGLDQGGKLFDSLDALDSNI